MRLSGHDKKLHKRLNYSAYCMKESKPFNIDRLLSTKFYKPIGARLPNIKHSGIKVTVAPATYQLLPADPSKGRNRPSLQTALPGRCVEVNKLSKDHPAVHYLLSRGLNNLDSLVNKFGLSFCEEEAHYIRGLCLIRDSAEFPKIPGLRRLCDINKFSPERRLINQLSATDRALLNCEDGLEELYLAEDVELYYRRSKLPPGWRDTPQGRLVFFSRPNYTPCQGWQARVLDYTDGPNKYTLHPDTLNWELTHTLCRETGKWISAFPDSKCVFSKYRNASGVSRYLMGVDSVLSKQQHLPAQQRWVVITEGPTDAAMFDYGCCQLGKTMTPRQAQQLIGRVGQVVTGFDSDASGETARQSVEHHLQGKVKSIVHLQPALGFKDFCEMGHEQTEKLLVSKLSHKNKQHTQK